MRRPFQKPLIYKLTHKSDATWQQIATIILTHWWIKNSFRHIHKSETKIFLTGDRWSICTNSFWSRGPLSWACSLHRLKTQISTVHHLKASKLNNNSLASFKYHSPRQKEKEIAPTLLFFAQRVQSKDLVPFIFIVCFFNFIHLVDGLLHICQFCH